MESRITALESSLHQHGRTLRTILIISSISCLFGLLKFFLPLPLTFPPSGLKSPPSGLPHPLPPP